MTAEKLVFRSIYVDRDVDEALRAHAERMGASKGKMFRTYLRTGMAKSRGGLSGAVLPSNGSRLAARTVYLPASWMQICVRWPLTCTRPRTTSPGRSFGLACRLCGSAATKPP